MSLTKSLASSLVLCILVGTVALAESIEVGPQDNWFELLSGPTLQPADQVILRSGTYTNPRRLSIQLRGTAEKPIVISAAERGGVIFRRPDAKQNSYGNRIVGNIIHHTKYPGITVYGTAGQARNRLVDICDSQRDNLSP